MEAAYRAEDLNYNAEVVAQWGRTHFSEGIPEAIVLEHAARLKGMGGDFAAMAVQQLRSLAPGRLNARSGRQLSAGQPGAKQDEGPGVRHACPVRTGLRT